MLKTGSLGIVEDGVEANHTALAYLVVVLDVKQTESARILLEVFNRICLAHASPVYVHFEEHVSRVGVLYHVVVEYHLVLDFCEFKRVVVISELHACIGTLLSHLVVIVAPYIEVLYCCRCWH